MTQCHPREHELGVGDDWKRVRLRPLDSYALVEGLTLIYLTSPQVVPGQSLGISPVHSDHFTQHILY